MIVRGAFAELLQPGLAWDYFTIYYRPRKRYERKKRYEAERREAFQTWIAQMPKPE